MKTVNNIYYNWLIVEKIRKSNSSYYIGKCIVCDNEQYLPSTRLSRAKCQNCNKKIGARYGKWTVLDKIQQKDKTTAYLCVCDCGNLREVPSNQLITGRSKQCKQCHNKRFGLAASQMLTDVWTTYRNNIDTTVKEIFKEKYDKT